MWFFRTLYASDISISLVSWAGESDTHKQTSKQAPSSRFGLININILNKLFQPLDY